ncbi:WXG100 family type VII secretion target [Streptomyces lasiicapitis]|uniref:WXG100 family type VII secretion target n=1 Tax=Streptomyces lasiicapitis TaxID=1923961 RepID=UPI0036996037
MSERVEECRRDLVNLKRFADEIDRTLDAVDAASGHEAWKGPAADHFREEWKRKRTKLHDALDAARGQHRKILQRVQEEEDKKKQGQHN